MKLCRAPRHRMILVMIASMAVSACSSGTDDQIPNTGTGANSAGQERTNAPLKPELVNIGVTVAKGPSYDAAADQLRVTVAVANNGPVTLPVTGRNPVTLGVVQKLRSEHGLPDRRGEESRTPLLEDIAPTQTRTVEVILPAEFVVGHKVEFDALQEGVAWFGVSYDQDTAVIGPFQRCDGGAGICDGKGQPIPPL